jgi:hypothetical protein
MQRGLFYAILLSAALLLQAAATSFAPGAAIHQSGACASDQIAFGASSATTEHGHAGQPNDHSRACDHCDWCMAGAPLATAGTIVVASATARFSNQPLHYDNFEPLAGARIDHNASPRAPPSLS